MGRLLVSGAGRNLGRHSVNALAADGQQRRGGDLKDPMRERSPARRACARAARPAGTGARAQARSAAQQHRHHSITAR
jgi:hypothetical protein